VFVFGLFIENRPVRRPTPVETRTSFNDGLLLVPDVRDMAFEFFWCLFLPFLKIDQ
jgi:hypothetical protein